MNFRTSCSDNFHSYGDAMIYSDLDICSELMTFEGVRDIFRAIPVVIQELGVSVSSEGPFCEINSNTHGNDLEVNIYINKPNACNCFI